MKTPLAGEVEMPRKTHLNFTRKRVESEFQHEAGKKSPTFFFDGACPGLGLRITPAGARSYIFQGTLNRKVVRYTIGAVADWRLPAVQQEARRLATLIDQGIDPNKEKKQRRIDAARSSMTLGEMFQMYIDSHPRKEEWPDRKDAWGDRHRADHEYAREHILKPLMGIRLSDVSVEKIRAWMDKSAVEGKKNTALRQSFMYISAAYRWAHKRPEQFGALPDPVLFAHDDLLNRRPPAGQRSDKLHPTELKKWFDAVLAIPSQTISAYLQCLLLFGCRRNELTRLTWDDIDHDRRTAHLHDKINTDGRVVPLGPYLYFLLSTLPRKHEKWVFAAARKMNSKSTGRLAEPTKGHKKALENAGLSPDISLHGLRRTWASIAGSLIPGNHARVITGHAPVDIHERVYEKLDHNDVRPSMEKMEAFILEKGGVEFDEKEADKIVNLARFGRPSA
jgi:integrase